MQSNRQSCPKTNFNTKSYTGSAERDTPIIAVGHLTTLYHIDSAEYGIVDVVEYLHPALVGNAGEIGTPPVVILNSSLAQLKRKKKIICKFNNFYACMMGTLAVDWQ